MNKLSHRRKRDGETAEYRFQRDTRDYVECVERNTWKIERRIAEEIIDVVKELELNLKLDRLTEYRYNSFPIALLQQLKRVDVYELLDQELKNLADQMDSKLLRKEIVRFIKTSNHIRIREFKVLYKESSGAAQISWNEYWKDMLNPSWTDHWFVQAAAWFLKLDIDIVRIEPRLSDEPNHIKRVYGMLNSSDGEANLRRKEIGPLFIGQKTDIHYQSLLPMNYVQEEKSIDKEGIEYDNKYNVKDVEEPENDPVNITKCPNCEESFIQILRHAAKKKSECYGKISEEFLNEVRKEVKAKQKARNTRYKAEQRARNEKRETMEERSDRLALQAYYMNRWRKAKRECDYELAKKEANIQKTKSRTWQWACNQEYGPNITHRSYC